MKLRRIALESVSPPPAAAGAQAAPCGPRPFIETEGLSLAYHGRVVLDDVSLTVCEGCVTALVGPSGCGKTSFLCCLNRLTDLIPGASVGGRVRSGDFEVFSPATDVTALRRQVGMIFQRPNPFPVSIRKNIELPLREHGARDPHEIESVLEQSLRDVGLWQEVKDRLHEPAPSLSGGQQQRLCIARSLALAPRGLLLDEPCGSLDPISTRVFEELIDRLRGRYTFLIVTHNLAQARRVADQAAVFWTDGSVGRLIEHGPAGRVFEAPQHPITASYVRGASG